jgi:hypothetical protein
MKRSFSTKTPLALSSYGRGTVGGKGGLQDLVRFRDGRLQFRQDVCWYPPYGSFVLIAVAHTFAMLSCPSRVPDSQFVIKASFCAVNGLSYTHYRLFLSFSNLLLYKTELSLIKNGLFLTKNTSFYIMNNPLLIKNEPFLIKNRPFFVKNEAFFHSSRSIHINRNGYSFKGV